MYKEFFGLNKEPFSTSPDPSFLAVLPQTREALASIKYGISSRKGIIVLTGEVGTGKTMLLRASLNAFREAPVHFAYVFNPKLDVLDFLEFVLIDFGLQPESRSKVAMLLQLNRWLLERYREQETCVIIVDEAQECSWELLEEIRLLTNLETASTKLVQVILSGQPELEGKLRKENARQLRQRVTLWCRTYPLDPAETGQYIVERVRLAGRDTPLLTEPAIQRVFALSNGIPRVINLLCEHALILAYVHRETMIGASIIDVVSQDLMLVGETSNVQEPGGSGLPLSHHSEDVIPSSTEKDAGLSESYTRNATLHE